MTAGRCPLTYAPLSNGQTCNLQALRRLDRRLAQLAPLAFDTASLRAQARALADKLSIQGVQPKLSAKLNVRAQTFVVTERGGTFILKPPNPDYPELPANEDLTMHMAACVGIEVPPHGLVQAQDGAWTYFIRRFDRLPRGKKIAVEDFAQLSGRDRDTKYSASMEQVVGVIDAHCTFPVVERMKFFLRVLFCFLTGNEDMHLKNFSLWTQSGTTSLAPAYDYLNTTIALNKATEELALPLRGKKSRLKANDFMLYLGHDRLRLTDAVIADICNTLQNALPNWLGWIDRSFLSADMRESYRAVLLERMGRLR